MHNTNRTGHLPRSILSFWLIALVLFSSNSMIIKVNADEATPNRVPIIVSLGDSYSSGEGIEPFYGQKEKTKNKIKNEDWLAHRSQKSWSGMLSLPSVSGTMADHRNENWFFVASSGATTTHINSEKQPKPYCYKSHIDNKTSLPLQLDIFDEIDKTIGENEVDYVTMTIGGNDAEFTDIVTAAATDIPYINPSKVYQKVTASLKKTEEGGEIYNNLKKTYSNICGAAGKQAKLIVAGYPKLLDPKGSGFLFGEYDAEIINQAAEIFNTAIEALVNTCQENEGMNIHFVSVKDVFEGHGAYSDESYINEIKPLQSEDLVDASYLKLTASGYGPLALVDKVKFSSVSAYSMHPNYEGAQAYAACVQAKINELENTLTETINYSVENTYSKELNISVLNYNLEKCENYTIVVEGKKSAIFGLLKTDYSDTITVSNTSTVSLILPEGAYTITVTDGSSSYSKKVKISSFSNNTELDFYTIFGYEIPKGENTNQEQNSNSATEESMNLADSYWSLSYGPTNGGSYIARLENDGTLSALHSGSQTFSSGKYSYKQNKLYVELDGFSNYFDKISDDEFKVSKPVYMYNGEVAYYYTATRITDAQSIKYFKEKETEAKSEIETGTDEDDLFYQYIKENLTLCKAYPSDVESEKGVVSALVEDFDNNGTKELLTFSITHNTSDQPQIVLNLYVIENKKVTLADTSIEIFISGVGNYQNETCAFFEGSLIKIQTEQCNFGGSSFIANYRTFRISNNQIILESEYSKSEFARNDAFSYKESVSGTTFTSAEEFYTSVDESGYNREEHQHVGFSDSEFDATKDDYMTAECFKGNHIFAAFSSLNFFVSGEYTFIYDNTKLSDKIK